MEVRLDDPELQDMETNLDYRGKWRALAVQFRKVMNIVRQSENEVELHNWRGLRLKKLEGDRSHQHSMRLNDQWRLIVEFLPRPGPNSNVCAVKKIEDYH